MDFIVDGLATGRDGAHPERRGCVHPRVSGAGGRHQPGKRSRDTGAGTGDRRAWPPERALDNGPEFTSRRMLAWAEDWKVRLHVQPGRPMQNGHVESFHGRLRDERLNASWFRTLNDVRCTLAVWREEYNCERPHSSLDYRTPMEFKLARRSRARSAPSPTSTIAHN